MKRGAVILCVLAGLAQLLCAQSAQPFTAQRLDNVKFPWGLDGLSVVDGALRGSAGGLRVVGERAWVSLGPDTLFGRLLPEAEFIVRNPADGNLYYTVNDKEGSRLYLYRGGKGAHGGTAVELQGWNGEICHPAFSPDGRYLVFSAAGGGGLGRHDLWCSRRVGDTWGHPVNLGMRINTQGDEVDPLFHGRYLLFASNGHCPGDTTYSFYSAAFPKAETDDRLIFYSYAVQRLPEPLNSIADDRGMAVDLQQGKGYWISSRDGHEALYCFSGSLEGIRYWGTVFSPMEQPVNGAAVTATVDGRKVAQTRTDAQGRYSLYLQPGTICTLGVAAKGMRILVDTLPLPRRDSDSLFSDVRHDVRLAVSPVGQPVILDNLFGPATDIELTEKGKALLMTVAQILRENNTLGAELLLMSKATGNAQFDDMLNERRLSTLREFFETYAPLATRISFKNGNAGGVSPDMEKGKDRLRVDFVE